MDSHIAPDPARPDADTDGPPEVHPDQGTLFDVADDGEIIYLEDPRASATTREQ